MTEKNLSLGAGKLYLDRFVAGTQVLSGERFIGNCPEFNMNIETETVDHYDSTEGTKEKDAQATLSVMRSASINCDNIIKENLAIALLGTASSLTQGALTAETSSFNSVSLGAEYQLGTSATNPSGVRQVTNVVVTDDTAVTPVTFDVTDDYTVDLALGRIKVVSGGAITAGTNLVVTYNVAASTRDLVVSGNDTFEGALRFISFNRHGKQTDYYMPYVRITPSGDISLIGDEWASIPLSVEALRKGALEAIYADGRAVAS